MTSGKGKYWKVVLLTILVMLLGTLGACLDLGTCFDGYAEEKTPTPEPTATTSAWRSSGCYHLNWKGEWIRNTDGKCGND